jgi:hypothetical protein
MKGNMPCGERISVGAEGPGKGDGPGASRYKEIRETPAGVSRENGLIRLSDGPRLHGADSQAGHDGH